VTARRQILVVGGLALISARPGLAQTRAPVRRIGVLFLPSEAATAGVRAAFAQEMHDLGWLEGRNIDYRFFYADGDVDRLSPLATEMIAQKVDVIVTPSPQATRVAQLATGSIPIVMVSVPNAVGAGFVASLARPGGNVTGISNQQEELMGKVIQILQAIVPAARRFAILQNGTSSSFAENWAAAQSACAALNLVALRFVASAPAQIAAAVEQIVQQRSQAVVVVRDGLFLNERTRLQALMQATRLPVAYGFREHVDAGGLLSYSADLAENFRSAAGYVDKILKGAKPADLPVAQPTRFELTINLRTADSLGLTVPASVLLRADAVIK
jgi:putative ABC transport system substrate-binding protein